MIQIIATILAVFAAFASFIVGVIVWKGEERNAYKRSFVILASLICLWIISNILFAVTTDTTQYTIALLSYGLAMLLAVELVIFCFHFVHKTMKRGLINLVYILGILMACYSMVPGVVARGVMNGQILTDVVQLSIYDAALLAYLVAACIVLLRARKTVKHIARQRIDLILVSMVVSALFGAVCNLLLPLVGVYWFVQLGPASAVIFISAVAYAIVRHGLFNIRLAIVRTVTYSFVLVVIIAFYFGIAASISFLLQGSSQNITQLSINVFVALIMALLFQPFKRFFDRLTKRFFYRGEYTTDDFYARLSSVLSSTTDLRGLLQRTAHEFMETLKVEQAFFFVYHGEDHYISTGTDHHSRMPVVDIHQIDRYVTSQPEHTKTIITELVMDESLRRLFVGHKIFITLPLVRGGLIVGYLFLGDRRSGDFGPQDIKVLETIADELVIAIQNALSIQEVKELNATLQQRIDTATQELRESNKQLRRLDAAKDEFVSMASHQLRTPLTSVKGYISMMLEGDAGEITTAQKHFLGEAFTSSERMVHLINDFLNVSRLQTGKFIIERRKVDLKLLTTQEVDSLRTTAGQRQLTLKLKLHGVLPPLYLDESKIRQVIMNFIDNAMYYSAPETAIVISLTKEADEAVLTVKDTGIGVPADEQAHLFTKFYRASNARKQRPDGTGVGLFLAKKIIVAHGGSMIFESEVGKGSTFGFRLPLEKLQRAPADDADNFDN